MKRKNEIVFSQPYFFVLSEKNHIFEQNKTCMNVLQGK